LFRIGIDVDGTDTTVVAAGQRPATAWPSLERSIARAATQDYLHLVTQMLGKLRLALAAPLPGWSHASLALTPRGLTTRSLPAENGSVEATLDLVDSVIRVSSSDGQIRTVELVPGRPVAEIWSGFRGALGDLGIDVDLPDKPQERADVTPFSEDRRGRTYDGALAAGWFALLTELNAMFDEFRSPFFGRSNVGFWWGGFDLSVVLFNGRHATPRAGSNYILRYDHDAEHLSFGFWPGDDDHEAMFFAYVVPEPIECAQYPIDIKTAGWAPAMGEWVMSYRAALEAPDPAADVRQFMERVLGAARDLAGWDLESLTYVAPPRGSR